MTSYDHTTITQLRTDTYKRNVVSVRSHTAMNHIDFRKGCQTNKVTSNWPDVPFSRLPFPLKQRKLFSQLQLVHASYLKDTVMF